MRVAFRTDASLQIGSGHVMRCLTLANALRENGGECIFICRTHPGDLIDQIRDLGFVVEVLQTADIEHQSAADFVPSYFSSDLSPNWQSDAMHTRRAIGARNINWLIVDHYGLDARWEMALRPVCKRLMVIDDLADRNHVCDVLIDQNLHEEAHRRYKALVPSSCLLLLGPTHAMLRPMFNASMTKQRSGHIGRVFIYFGGYDVFNQAGKAIEAVRDFPDIVAEVVLGTSHLHREDILAAHCNDERLRVMESCNNMAEVMARADIGMGACGTTTWERCAMGLPALVCITAENQREDAALLDRLGAVVNLGEASNLSAERWKEAISRLISSPSAVANMAVAARNVVEGHQENFSRLVEIMCR